MSTNQISIKLDELNSLPPAKIVENDKVESKFVSMYNAIWGAGQGTAIYNKEKFNFQKLLQDNPDLASCTRLSLYGCFLDMAVNGLSLDPTGRPHCYLIPRNCKTGYKDANGKDVYEKRAAVNITGYGELVMRQRAGQIKYVDNPVIVFEGDVFSIDLENGQKKIHYKAAIPRKSCKVTGAFIRIVRNDGSEDFQWLLEGDIERLKGYSGRANSYYDKGGNRVEKPNALYSSNNGGIDSGFLENKMIKHAFDAYPKVRTGQFTQLQTMEEPEQEIDYGIEDAGAVDMAQAKPLPFGEDSHSARQPETSGHVTVPTSQEDDDAGF